MMVCLGPQQDMLCVESSRALSKGATLQILLQKSSPKVHYSTKNNTTDFCRENAFLPKKLNLTVTSTLQEGATQKQLENSLPYVAHQQQML